MSENTRELMLSTLQIAVPMWIEELRHIEPEQRLARASGLADIIASQGDIILYRGGKKGETAKAFNAMAEGLAIGAYQPGGVTFLGQHWCTDHEACLAAAS
jgi:hypothetical protein